MPDNYPNKESDISINGYQYHVVVLESWWNRAHPTKLRNLPVLIFWSIWIGRNKFIFQENVPN